MSQVIIEHISIFDNEKSFITSKNKVLIKQDAFYNSSLKHLKLLTRYVIIGIYAV